ITRDITARKIEAREVQDVLAERYAGEKFVTVRPFADRSWLERDRFLRADRLIDTNSMELAVYANPAEEQILAVASLDNLGKGASGAAVQTINPKTGVGAGCAAYQPQAGRGRGHGPHYRLTVDALTLRRAAASDAAAVRALTRAA